MTIEVRGADGVHRMLQAYTEPKLTKRLQTATKDGATVLKPAVKAEAAKVSRRLSRSVSVRKAKRELPATIVTFRPKVAFFRHWIIRGTRDHGPRKAALLSFIPNWNPYFGTAAPSGASQVRTKTVRGMKPDPIMDRIADQFDGRVYQAIDQSLDKTEA